MELWNQSRISSLASQVQDCSRRGDGAESDHPVTFRETVVVGGQTWPNNRDHLSREP
jgi:hypothetical protein